MKKRKKNIKQRGCSQNCGDKCVGHKAEQNQYLSIKTLKTRLLSSVFLFESKREMIEFMDRLRNVLSSPIWNVLHDEIIREACDIFEERSKHKHEQDRDDSLYRLELLVRNHDDPAAFVAQLKWNVTHCKTPKEKMQVLIRAAKENHLPVNLPHKLFDEAIEHIAQTTYSSWMKTLKNNK